ncbi:hypothetical protein SDC49_05685 [Lactobacillus sp. R2/2]|nr:hypothetical protein [Lactobacillus sp. R2/2]
MVLAGNIFPTNFYPAVIKKLAAYLPFQYSFGAVGMLAQKPSWSLFIQVVLIQLTYIALFNVLFKFLFKRSVVSTVIQGG